MAVRCRASSQHASIFWPMHFRCCAPSAAVKLAGDCFLHVQQTHTAMMPDDSPSCCCTLHVDQACLLRPSPLAS
jgi:hypothetical protein